MSDKNNSNYPNISNALIVFFMIFCTPIGIILAVVKYLLPYLTSFLLSSDSIYERKNRYSGYEKRSGGKGTIYTEFTNAENRKNKSRGEDNYDTEYTNADLSKNGKIKKKIPGEGASRALLTFGAVFSAIPLLALISELISGGTEIFYLGGFAPSALAALCLGVALGGFGLKLRGKVKRIKKYIAVIGDRGRVSISEIASSFSIPSKKVLKELQEAIDSGIFGDYAYIDVGRQLFLRNSSFVPKEESGSGEAKSEREKADNPDDDDPSEYERTLRKIRRLNDDIEDVPVSERIDRIEDYTRRIFDCVKKDPDREKDVHTFMTYYLPTTLKLLESYSEIENVGVAGENMKSAKENIEKTLDLLVEAYKRLLDQLYASESMDISSDIDVLERMMYKDGLAGSDFGGNKND